MAPVTRFLITLVLVPLVLSGSLSAQKLKATARVKKAGRSTIETYKNVIIEADSYRGVKARQKSQTWTWPVDRVVEIKYQQSPEPYRKAIVAFEEGDYEDAAILMREALETKKKFPWLAAYGNWYAGESLRRLGMAKDAIAHYQTILDKASKSRFYPATLAAIAGVEMMRNNGKEAKRWYKKLLDLAQRQSLPVKFKSLAELGLATAEARFGDPKVGLQKLQAILASTTDKGVKNKCLLEIGHTHISQEDYTQARTYFERIRDGLDPESPDLELIAGSTNGLGDCEWKLKEYKKAGLTFSKVYSLFYDRRELRSEVAWALFMGGKAFRAQAARSADAEQKKLLGRRARKLWRRVVNDFKGTRGQSMASQELGN